MYGAFAALTDACCPLLQGYVNVTETLNLPGYGNVFVAGDIASSAVTLASKTATPAKAQVCC